jgi:hypothetical protein
VPRLSLGGVRGIIDAALPAASMIPLPFPGRHAAPPGAAGGAAIGWIVGRWGA